MGPCDLGRDPAGLGQVPRRQWEPGNEGDPSFLTAFQDILGVTIGQVEPILHRDDLDDLPSLFQLGNRHVRDADVPDLAFVLSCFIAPTESS